MISYFAHKRSWQPYILCCLVFIMNCRALNSQVPDTAVNNPPPVQFNWKATVLVPAILAGYGLSTTGDNGLFVSSRDVYEGIRERWPGFQTNADDYLVYVPAVAVYGLNLAGVKGKNNIVDRSIIYGVSHTAALVTFRAIKRSTGVLRPDSSDNRSMPSGHTTLAFVSATFFFEEFKDKSILIGLAGYSVATATGVIRMLNNKHWMSDVFVGADSVPHHVLDVIRMNRAEGSELSSEEVY